MSVGAQLAQNSKLYISGAGTSPVTITAITKAFHAEVTGTNTYAKGDRVTFASVVGMTEINGLSATVQAATGSSFVVDIDSRAFTTYGSGGTATGVAWTQVKQVKAYKPSGATASPIDVTDMDSVAKEFLTGLIDNGTLSADVFHLASDPGQAAVSAAFAASLSKSYKIAVNGGNTFTFTASVTKFPTIPDGQVDGVLTGTLELKVSGAVSVT